MADDVDWKSEDIPDQDRTFMRAHETFFRDDELQPGVFRNHNGGMSVDWEKYSTPQETQQRGKEPNRNSVISLVAEDIREIDQLAVKHTPKISHPANRAHSDVTGLPDDGEDQTEIRIRLLDISDIVLKHQAPKP
jgi:hypothetical protein